MKIILIFSLFAILFIGVSDYAFADHSEVTIIPANGSGALGCEETSQGCYIPSTATVDVGGVVIFSNTDSAAHTFTSSNGDNIPNGVFDSGLAMVGSTFEWSPSSAGFVDYFCIIHPWMQGLIIVQETESDEEPEISCDSSYPDFCIPENSPVLDCDEIPYTDFRVYYPDPHGFDGDNDGIGCETYSAPPPTKTYPPASSSADVKVARDSATPGCERYDSCYSPSTIRIQEDSTLTWYNADAAAHTVTSGTPGRGSDGEFDSSLFMSGSSFSHKFDRDGTFPYYCAVHPWMEGTVVVEAKPPVYTPPPTYTPPVYTPPTYTPPPVSIPSGTDVVIPQDTSSLGCEETRSCYDPYSITGGKGSTITWFNADSAFHTVTSGNPKNPDSDGNLFDSGMLMSGDSFSYKFSKDGSYNYFCMLHPWMEGQVVISREEVVNEPTPTYPSPTRDTTPPKILKPTDVTVDAENNNGTNVSYDVLVIDETDQIVRPSCNPSSGSMFTVGTTKVTCNAMDSAGNRAQSVSFSVTVNPPALAIPNWVKNVASFWCDDKIDNSSFIEAIQYLIDNDIIIVSTTASGYGNSQDIPQWVKNNACWWSEGLISDTDFASGIEYLVKEGIIQV